jgi:hypothetical protein
LQQKRFVGVFNRVGFFAHTLSQRRQTYRLTAKAVAQRDEDGPVNFVQSESIYPEEIESLARRIPIDGSVTPHFSEVTHPPQQAIRDPGRAAGPLGNSSRTVDINLHLQDPSRSLHDGSQVFWRIQVQPANETESVTQRT